MTPNMAKKQFKTESKRILDLMINSIYTHKEIFLRELISNASDAVDKLCYRSLTDDKVGLNREDFHITLKVDKENRQLTVSDNGIGMTAKELEENLGVIAKSGSLQFKQDMAENGGEKSEDIDIIGQFGVGFYSAFMVAEKVTVVSRAYGEETANRWVSSGADGYSITPCEKDAAGTEIIIDLKADTENETYSDFLEEDRLKSIIKKYSDYVRWPILLGEETVNSMVPIWQRPKNEVSDEDCFKFYKEKFHDFQDPLSVTRVNAEGTVSYKAMLFVPAQAPFNYYTAAYEPGLQLYTSGVMIMEKCAPLLPEYFRFVQGVVDSQDLSLNISRELLQHDRQLKIIAVNIEKKIKSELLRMLEKDRETYEKFFRQFGLQLKYGVVADFGAKKDFLSELILVWSSKEEKWVTFGEYVSAMPEEQKYIYYACGENISMINGLPQTEQIRDKGYDILCLTDSVDEFVVQMLGSYMEKEFRSVNADDLGLEDGEEKEKLSETETENQELLDFVKTALEGKISSAKVSRKLKTHPVCLTTEGPISLEMEKYFNSIPAEEGQAVKAQRVLEINAGHPVFAALKKAYGEDREKAEKYARLLYCQSLLIAGIPLEDPTGFSDLICDLMV